MNNSKYSNLYCNHQLCKSNRISQKVHNCPKLSRVTSVVCLNASRSLNSAHFPPSCTRAAPMCLNGCTTVQKTFIQPILAPTFMSQKLFIFHQFIFKQFLYSRGMSILGKKHFAQLWSHIVIKCCQSLCRVIGQQTGHLLGSIPGGDRIVPGFKDHLQDNNVIP